MRQQYNLFLKHVTEFDKNPQTFLYKKTQGFKRSIMNRFKTALKAASAQHFLTDVYKIINL